jgi:hypothetical protein
MKSPRWWKNAWGHGGFGTDAWVWAMLVFLGSLVAFEWVWGSRFYTSATHVGHDFALTGVALLEGRNWLEVNGWSGWLSPPWFTPAWCAGAAFFADPQAAFYSPLQLLATHFDPFAATHLNTLLFAGVAYAGGYLLARKVFGWSAWGSIVFGLLGMTHAFLPLRSAVGEAGYQPFYLWTLLVLALCWPARAGRIPWPSIAVGLTLTAWLHFGFGGMMVPAFIASFALGLAMVLTDRVTLHTLVARAALGGVLAIAINGLKIYEAASLLRNFPRNFYAIPGFPQLGDVFAAIAFSLFQPSQWTTEFAAGKLRGVQFSVLPHEWALNFSAGALLIALACSAYLLARRTSRPVPAATVRPAQALAVLGLALIVATPVLLLWSQGAVQDLIKRIPILNSTTWPMRWIVIYVPLLQWMLAAAFEHVARPLAPVRGAALTVAAAAVVWAAPLMEPLDYYLSPQFQGYDPKPVVLAHLRTEWRGAIPIQHIVVPQGQGLRIDRNDTMLYGASQAYCYNPIYGYRLESFPQLQRLRGGPALQADERGRSMLINPACLMHPAENGCKPGDGFDLADPHQRAQAERFLARKPFEWQRPQAAHVLAWISRLTLLALLGLAVLAVIGRLRVRTSS